MDFSWINSTSALPSRWCVRRTRSSSFRRCMPPCFSGPACSCNRERPFPDIDRPFVQQLKIMLDHADFDRYIANHG
jgi:hypothetical protein